MNIPFRIPVNSKLKKRFANLLGVEIVEKISDAQYIHTLPQSKIDTWNSERRIQDKVDVFKNEAGFHMKRHGRDGIIYYVDDSLKVCECYYELSGVPEYDILLHTNEMNEWFLPITQPMTDNEKNVIINKMQSWLHSSNIKFCL